MSAAPRPALVDSRRQFWWGEHELIDYGVPAHIGTSAWTVYTCLLRHVNAKSVTFPSVKLLMAETGLSNRVVGASIATLKTVGLIEVDRESHQWNVYQILDATHAIRKNGWERVKDEARDEKSPAEEPAAPRRKHVTKSHLPRDEKSPEQVTNRHTKKNHLKTTIEEPSVSTLTGDVREDAPLVAPLAVEPGPASYTTGEGASEPTPVAQLRPVAGVAVLPPDGGAADAAITDTELDFLFGTGQGLQETVPLTIGENVPPAGAAALLGSPVRRVDLLMPVPAHDLRDRPLAMPSEEVYRLVKRLVGGNRAIDDGILETLTPAGALSRQDWLRLTVDELEELRHAAQAEAQDEKLNFYTCAIRGLDRLIGAPIGQTLTRGVSTVTPNANSTAPAKHYEAIDHSADLGKLNIGACWTPKGQDTPVVIEAAERVQRRDADGLVYRLSNGKTVNALQLMTGYVFTPGAEVN